MLLAWNTEEHDMIFRAVFWIGLVSLLAPHDLGLGAIGTGHPSPATTSSAANGLSRTGPDCGFACAGGPLSVFHLSTNPEVMARLADVKAEIEQDRRDRAAKARSI